MTKLSKDHVRQIEEHTIRLIGKSRLNPKDKKRYEFYINGVMGAHAMYELRLLDMKIERVSRLKSGNLWRKTKGDFAKVIKWVEKYKDNEALVVIKKLAETPTFA